jgi:hypothetical protein
MSHCFIEKYDVACHPKDEPILHDTAGRPRSFCRVRYGISVRLPEMITQPSEGDGHPNGTRAELAPFCFDRRAAGQISHLFELRRAAGADRERQDLNLVVESAYHQDPTRSQPAVRGTMGFILLCGKVYKGEPISTRR